MKAAIAKYPHVLTRTVQIKITPANAATYFKANPAVLIAVSICDVRLSCYISMIPSAVTSAITISWVMYCVHSSIFRHEFMHCTEEQSG